MKIISLSLANFRNYESQQVFFDGGLNVLHGKNASGKTNMLESVYLCSLLRSPRTTKDKELIRMGANITIQGRDAIVQGIQSFYPANVRAVDLRAGAAMVIAALSADGTTIIEDIYHIQRGYEDMVGKLRAVGADIKVITDDIRAK